VLGDTTHVVLSFVLLGQQRAVLDAAPGQRRTVVFGSLLVFVASMVMFMTPSVSVLTIAVVYLWSTVHRLGQFRGMWSLYNLVGQRAGLPAPTKLELKVQRAILPLGLALVVVRGFMALPSDPAALPFVTVPDAARFALIAVWLAFCALAVSVTRGAWSRSGKPLYVGLVGLSFCALLWSPVWGSILVGSIHGLEYMALTWRMLDGPRKWLSIVGGLTPFVLVGALSLPFVPASIAQSAFTLNAEYVMSAVVLVHYFVDGVIYRLRIPSVRSVMLARLQLA
jgi:hypothetical protein